MNGTIMRDTYIMSEFISQKQQKPLQIDIKKAPLVGLSKKTLCKFLSWKGDGVLNYIIHRDY